ncbi:MAG: hypothetical protein ACEY3D_03765 [Rickettsia sp.]
MNRAFNFKNSIFYLLDTVDKPRYDTFTKSIIC